MQRKTKSQIYTNQQVIQAKALINSVKIIYNLN